MRNRVSNRSNDSILSWVHCYPRPPDNFSALREGDNQLATYGLPTRPDPGSDPVRFRFWERLLAPGTIFVLPEFQDPEPKAAALVAESALAVNGERLQDKFQVSGRGHLTNSRNWSGAFLTPPRPSRFTGVAGSWTVPMPSIPKHKPYSGTSHVSEYQSSTWIGLGGFRRYNSLPQIGTSQIIKVIGGAVSVEFGAWWQWWVADDDRYHVPVPIMNFPVQPSDVILANMTVEAPNDVLFHLKNQRTGILVNFKVSAPSGIHALGATAEWIHERPTKTGSRERYALPKCSDVEFEHCFARSARIAGDIESTHPLDHARFIRLFEEFEDPYRIAMVSAPRRVGRTSFRIEYREPGERRSDD